MFTIRLVTERYAPGQTVLMRWAPNWIVDRGGVYIDGAWTFELDEQQFPNGLDFKLVNYRNAAGSEYDGGQGFNLGGRSVFWGGLIPRQAAWELGAWPAPVREYLLGGGYDAAERALNATLPAESGYQAEARELLQKTIVGYAAADAPVAVQYRGATSLAIPAGLFSTADLIMEDRLLDDPGYRPPTVNLNVAVWSVLTDPANPARVTGVRGWDTLAGKVREFRGRTVVLSAGTLESAKIALQSGLTD